MAGIGDYLAMGALAGAAAVAGCDAEAPRSPQRKQTFAEQANSANFVRVHVSEKDARKLLSNPTQFSDFGRSANWGSTHLAQQLVEKVAGDQEFLKDVVEKFSRYPEDGNPKSWHDRGWAVACAALKEMPSPSDSYLKNLHRENPSASVRGRALGRVKDMGYVNRAVEDAAFSKSYDDQIVARAAIWNQGENLDQKLVSRIVKESPDYGIRQAAVKASTDYRLLVNYALMEWGEMLEQSGITKETFQKVNEYATRTGVYSHTNSQPEAPSQAERDAAHQANELLMLKGDARSRMRKLSRRPGAPVRMDF